MVPVIQHQARTLALVVENLRKTFLIPVIDTVSFQVCDGEFVCLLGPNGCGKTTLLRIIAGIEHADSGTISIHGSVLHRDKAEGHRIGYVFQEPRLLPWRTILHNVTLAVERTCHLKSHDAKTLAHRYLQLVGLAGFEDYFPNRLSGGMQQRASIARALAVQPELLLMDEPFSALDPENRRILQDELQRIWHETNVTVLFVTHNVDEALRLATRLLVLSARPTRILLDIYTEDIKNHEGFKQKILDIFSEQIRIQQSFSNA